MLLLSEGDTERPISATRLVEAVTRGTVSADGRVRVDDGP